MAEIDASKLTALIKDIAKEATPETTKTDLVFGEVVSTDPLKIRVANEAQMILSESFLLLSNDCKPLNGVTPNGSITELHPGLQDGQSVKMLRVSGGQLFYVMQPYEQTVWHLPEGGGGEYTLPQATTDALGGIKADPATSEDTQSVRIDPETGKLRTKSVAYTLPQASADILGGVKADPRYDSDDQPVRIEPGTGKMYTATYKLPQASTNVLGGVKASPKTSQDTQPVHIDTATGEMYVPQSGGSYVLPQATTNALGGIKADNTQSEDIQPVRIDPETGKLFTAGGSKIPEPPDDSLLYSRRVKSGVGNWTKSTETVSQAKYDELKAAGNLDPDTPYFIYDAPASAGISTIQAGDGISVDNTDAYNPKVSVTDSPKLGGVAAANYAIKNSASPLTWTLVPGSTAVYYCKNSIGTVYVAGDSGALEANVDKVIGTLPAGFRPITFDAYDLWTQANSYWWGRIRISTNGSIIVRSQTAGNIIGITSFPTNQ